MRTFKLDIKIKNTIQLYKSKDKENLNTQKLKLKK